MKKRLLMLVLVCMLVLPHIGCEGCRKLNKHLKSTAIGLERQVTLFAYDGAVIRRWKGRLMVEINGPVASFIDDSGKEVKIAGIFIIEEK